VNQRQAVLKRKPYLDDLILQNAKLQRRIGIEAQRHRDMDDPCESLAIHEGAPIIAQYTQLEQDFYLLVERTETATEQGEDSLGKLQGRTAELSKRRSEFQTHWQAKNCQ
jgi:hypothetical protein